MKKFVLFTLVAFAGLLLSGCYVDAPDITNQSVPVTATNHSLTTHQVRTSIIRAGDHLGWTVRDVDHHTLQAELVLHHKKTIVTIPYTADSYSILLKSTNYLNDDGDVGKQHYQHWVNHLNSRIQAELQHVASGATPAAAKPKRATPKTTL